MLSYLLASTLLLAGPVSPSTAPQDSTRSMNGVTVPTRIEVAGQSLVLNGMALRKKVIFKVYVAALYLAAAESDAQKAVGLDAPRRMGMHFVRDVEAGKICEAWDEGLANNTPNPSEQLKSEFKTLCEWMEDIKDGEAFVFTYVPGEGTTVEVRGINKGSIGGKEFADALLNCWIGPKPGPGEGFKKKLLGLES
jgi:hypothetical protein